MTTTSPPREPTLEWCHPRDHDKQTWILIFEDQDRASAVYHNEAEARAAFASAEDRGWNCNLFTSVRRAPRSAAREPVAHRYRWAKPIIGDDERWRYSDGTDATLFEGNTDLIVEYLMIAPAPARSQDERKEGV